jgi:alkylhydroperoxidase/carboxymuconolactone decarboxylase family protein YurZ
MDEKQQRERGMAKRRKVMGNAYVDKTLENRTPFNTEFQDLITRYAWGEVWAREHFDERTRRILVIGTMIALRQWEEFTIHTRAALAERSLTVDDIKEIILQQTIYCGAPAANHATRLAGEIVKEAAKG